ncbi:MAG: hypothetical protein CSYNP_04156 [Syntrophus sp. SKADARSKE-3]|nr:hypothetical protein [Syntrophus sp. SKADARSKE-3]
MLKRKRSIVWIAVLAAAVFAFAGGVVGAAKRDGRSANTFRVAPGPHARASVDCSRCHGKALPREGAEVENGRCLACHGPMEKLVKSSTPKDSPDRNPHKSHLGDIACSVCHREHAAPKVYCLDCHPKFGMKLPDREKQAK